MDKRTLGIILTIATVLFCGCPGLLVCLAGASTIAYVDQSPTAPGSIGPSNYPAGTGYVGICLGLVLLAIPIVIGVLMLRKPKTTISVDVVPPAS